MKNIRLKASLVSLFLLVFWGVYKGENRVSVWMHHGIWLPADVTEIEFLEYPWMSAHLIGLDDVAKTEFKIPQSALTNILKGSNYDQNGTHLEKSTEWMESIPTPQPRAEYMPIDNILKESIVFPLELDLQSKRGSFLIFNASDIGNGRLLIRLYTDWN